MLYLHDFTGVYKKQSFYKSFDHIIFENSRLSGVRGYMDDEARAYLLDEIKTFGRLSAIHFLDSGNYHHLSRMYLELIEVSYNLVVYDNHTDMQCSAFGNILSCGSWIADSYESLDKLNKIFIIGANRKYIEDCKYNENERVVFADSIVEVTKENNLPVYISVDKDVLSKEEFISDWDQGKMSVSTLISELKNIISNFQILGVDICGEPLPKDSFSINLSNNINKELVNIFVDILY